MRIMYWSSDVCSSDLRGERALARWLLLRDPRHPLRTRRTGPHPGGRLMTVPSRPQTIEMIPLDAIHVLNPRARNRRQHHEIVANIAAVCLKRPLTVSRRAAANSVRYHLVCGAGRTDAFRLRVLASIPAALTFVIASCRARVCVLG